jgi:hypothetical protein
MQVAEGAYGGEKNSRSRCWVNLVAGGSHLISVSGMIRVIRPIFGLIELSTVIDCTYLFEHM